jgi:hypothetical protein
MTSDEDAYDNYLKVAASEPTTVALTAEQKMGY